MPKFKIETMAMIRRTYELDAESEEDAVQKLNDGGVDASLEEEINEDIDDVTEVEADRSQAASGG